MKTIILNNPGELQIINRSELEAPLEGEAIIKIRRIGICGTDYHAFRGKQPFFSYPRVLGHEIGAEITAIGGSGKYLDLKVGDKVALEPYINCNDCQACRDGHINCCEKIQVMGVHADGGMTEYLKVPVRKLHASNLLSFDQLALVETLGIGLHAVNRASLSTTDKVLIIGAGPIGLSVAQFAKLKGGRIAMADRSKSRLKFVEDHQMTDTTIPVEDTLTSDYIRTFFDGDLPNVIIDASGNQASMLNTFNIAAHGAKIVFVGLFQGDVVFHDPNFHKRELTLLASRNAMPEDFKTIISLIESKQIDTLPWLSHRTTFEQLPTSFLSFLEPDQEVIKAIIDL
ncbi:alcohol dehydrogenase [Dyadobacter jejuensis]|uniref:Alcohol dehydrogenase n=1 Tax=Dyadobacter jejuensis TaxID=1082580 RepID=A0A316AJY9_9BACT|nr:zinc-binding alcohol dehydrogenase family protein [Dyadobacter jejuensis]PWJ57976.1 alcohol dehydrogenase [Dyadobacter jejuensis]